MTKRVGLYLRVSTKNGQTIDNQRQALNEAIGRRPGWFIAQEFADEGISGAKGLDKRPEFDRPRAREKGTKSCRPIGRARIDATKEGAIRTALATGKGIPKTARECGTGTSVVQRTKAETARANSASAASR